MMEIPSSPWIAEPPAHDAFLAAPVEADWRMLPGTLRHVFTHFEFEMQVATARIDGEPPDGLGIWLPVADLAQAALPSVMRKIVRHAVDIPGASAIPASAPNERMVF